MLQDKDFVHLIHRYILQSMLTPTVFAVDKRRVLYLGQLEATHVVKSSSQVIEFIQQVSSLLAMVAK